MPGCTWGNATEEVLATFQSDFDKFVEKVLHKQEVMNRNVSIVQQKIKVINTTFMELQKSAMGSSYQLSKLENVTIPKMAKKSKESKAKLMNAIIAMEIHDSKLSLLMYELPAMPSANAAAVVSDAIVMLRITDEKA